MSSETQPLCTQKKNATVYSLNLWKASLKKSVHLTAMKEKLHNSCKILGLISLYRVESAESSLVIKSIITTDSCKAVVPYISHSSVHLIFITASMRCLFPSIWLWRRSWVPAERGNCLVSLSGTWEGKAAPEPLMWVPGASFDTVGWCCIQSINRSFIHILKKQFRLQGSPLAPT